MEGTDDWVPAAANTPIVRGDRIWAPEGGRAELQIRDGSVVRLAPVSLLEISAVDDEGVRFFLAGGSSYVVFRGGNKRHLLLDTPGATLEPYRYSTFRVGVSGEGDAAVSARRGEILADRGSGAMKIKAGEAYLFHSDGRYPEMVQASPVDAWERWSRERDGQDSDVPRSYSSSYLPEELRPYGNDLDNYGRWVYASDYGYVWIPTAFQVQNWSPYRLGRWVWMRGDYVWISLEPWGWVPYHYGRWAHLPGIGWCWVPPAVKEAPSRSRPSEQRFQYAFSPKRAIARASQAVVLGQGSISRGPAASLPTRVSVATTPAPARLQPERGLVAGRGPKNPEARTVSRALSNPEGGPARRGHQRAAASH